MDASPYRTGSGEFPKQGVSSLGPNGIKCQGGNSSTAASRRTHDAGYYSWAGFGKTGDAAALVRWTNWRDPERELGIVAIEACGSAPYWVRELRKLGHEVRLVAAQFVRPFVKTNKTDAADAAGIWEAVQRPDMRFVAVKSEERQSVLALYRMREQLVKIDWGSILAVPWLSPMPYSAFPMFLASRLARGVVQTQEGYVAEQKRFVVGQTRQALAQCNGRR